MKFKVNLNKMFDMSWDEFQDRYLMKFPKDQDFEKIRFK